MKKLKYLPIVFCLLLAVTFLMPEESQKRVWAADTETSQTPTPTAAPTNNPTPTVTPTKKPTATPTQAAKKKNGLVKSGSKYYYYSSGKKIKNKWKTVKGKKYYFGSRYYAVTGSNKISGKIYVFNSSGQLCTGKKSRFEKVSKYTYYLDKNGIAKTGWFQVSKKLYYANSKGQIQMNKTVEGIKLDKKGVAKNGTARSLKLKCKSLISSITTSKMTKSQKLYACWKYVVNNVSYSSAYYPKLSSSTWWRDTAYRTLSLKRGNCYGYACAFGALASELGYDVKIVAGYVPGSRDGGYWTRHSWVLVNGAHYDPEAQAAGWLTGVYGYGYYPMTNKVSKTVNYKTGKGN